ncbi:MAG: caspase family protein, partial [Rhodospirillaceae bacterium]|nr:caspase family protein [Rhodospirillaceae bacterium]
MLKHRTFIFLIIFMLAVFIVSLAAAQRSIVPVPNTTAGKINKGQNWLFVIGINKYDHWPILKSAVNDAKSLKKVLTSRYEFDDEHTVELYDKEATREGIMGKLRYLANHVKPNDSLMIFYAGHGHVDQITKVGHWIPVESETKSSASYLSNFDVKSYLKIDAIKAKHILLISDSCFAGEFFRTYRNAPATMATKSYIKKAYKLPSRMAITSGGLEPVSDDGFEGNSIFTYYLLTALKTNSRPFLLPSDIF